MELELIKKDEVKAELVFFTKGGAKAIVEAIKIKALDFTADVNTSDGRKKIASQAHSVTRSKTFLDDAGKDLKSEWAEKCKLVDNERKFIRDELDALKEQIRKPLTDFENAEMERAKAEAKKAEDARLAEEAKKKADQEEKERKFNEEQDAIKKANAENERKIREQQIEIENQKKALADEKKAQEQENARLKAENDRLKSQEAEQAREKTRSTRGSIIATRMLHGFQDSSIDLARISEKDFSEYLVSLESKKQNFESNQKKIQEENTRLKAEQAKRDAEQKEINDKLEAEKVAKKKLDDELAKNYIAFDEHILKELRASLLVSLSVSVNIKPKTDLGIKTSLDVSDLLRKTIDFLEKRIEKLKAV